MFTISIQQGRGWPLILIYTAVTVACGTKKIDQTTPATLTSSTADHPVGSLSLLPDTSTFTASKSASLWVADDEPDYALLAVKGTPPVVAEITADTIEKNFTGPVSSIVTAVQTAQQAANWTTVKSKVDEFRAAATKCALVEMTGRSINELNQSTGSMCYMSTVGAKGAGILAYKSGTKVDDGEFFSPATADVVRKISFGGEMAKQMGAGIAFKISGKTSNPDGYKVAFAMCGSDNKATQYSVIDVNNKLGTFTFETKRSASETRGGEAAVNSNAMKLAASLKYDGTKGAYTFDPDQERSFTVQNKFGGSKMSGTFNGYMKVKDNDVSSKLYNSHSFQSNDGSGVATTMTQLNKNIAKARFSGTKLSDLKVYEGAVGMYHKGASSFAGASKTFEANTVTGMEYNSDKAPLYDSVATGAYYDSVNKDFGAIATDSFFTAATPTDPDTGDISAKGDAICQASADSEYTMTMGAGFKAAMDSCDGDRPKGFSGSICDGIRKYDRAIQESMNSRRAATGETGVGK